MKTVKYEAIVHKANLALAPGESVGQYLAAVRTAAQDYVRSKLNLNVEKSSVFMVEVFSNSTVVETYEWGQGAAKERFWALKYSRKNNGGFDFSDMKEVVKLISFSPKEQISITKSAEEQSIWVEKLKFWVGVV